MKKHISKILYLIGLLIVIPAIIITGVSMSHGYDHLRGWGIAFTVIGMILIIIGFLLDFRSTMIMKETAGDRYTLMSKHALIKLLDDANIEYEEGKGREYYLYLVRENYEK